MGRNRRPAGRQPASAGWRKSSLATATCALVQLEQDNAIDKSEVDVSFASSTIITPLIGVVGKVATGTVL